MRGHGLELDRYFRLCCCLTAVNCRLVLGQAKNPRGSAYIPTSVRDDRATYLQLMIHLAGIRDGNQ